MNSITNMAPGPNQLRLRRLVALLLVSCAASWPLQGLAGAAAVTTASPAGLPARYPARSIQSVDVADRALREAIKRRYAADENACFAKFFATACLNNAKERRRIELAALRPVEVEANSFKRRARAAARDKALMERQARDAADPLQHRTDEIAQNANSSGNVATDAPGVKTRTADADRRRDAAARKRVAEHEIKLKRRRTDEIADAKKRAENVSAYDRKVRDAKRHQLAVAARKANKQRDTTAKDAAKSASAPSIGD